MRKEPAMACVLRGVLMVMYVPLMIFGPFLAMGGEAYIGEMSPVIRVLSDAAYWASMAFPIVIPVSVAGSLLLRRRGQALPSWLLLLQPLLWLAMVALLYTAADMAVLGAAEVLRC